MNSLSSCQLATSRLIPVVDKFGGLCWLATLIAFILARIQVDAYPDLYL